MDFVTPPSGVTITSSGIAAAGGSAAAAGGSCGCETQPWGNGGGNMPVVHGAKVPAHPPTPLLSVRNGRLRPLENTFRESVGMDEKGS